MLKGEQTSTQVIRDPTTPTKCLSLLKQTPTIHSVSGVNASNFALICKLGVFKPLIWLTELSR